MKRKKKTKSQSTPKPKPAKQTHPRRTRRPLKLRFSPTAWAKLLYFRDKTDNEVGGFGVTPADDLLYVQDFVTVQQQVSCISVDFDDDAVADFFEAQVDQGRRPEQFARLWIHTHPGDSPQPSGVDEATFERVFGLCDWSVMFIMAHNDSTYARMSFNVGPGGQVLIPTEVDFGHHFEGSSQDLWDQEYDSNVCPHSSIGLPSIRPETGSFWDDFDQSPFDLLDSMEDLDPLERQDLLEDLAGRPELWGLESEVMSI